MPTFVWIGNSRVNADHIVSIEPKARGRDGSCWTVTLINGRTLESTDGLEDCNGSIVPAPPGFVLVEAYPPGPSDPDRTVDYDITAIVAFRAFGSGEPTPITLNGDPPSGRVWAVIQPDGQCIGWGDTWDSLDTFKAAQQAVADAQREPSRPTTDVPAEDHPQIVPAAGRDRYEQAKEQPSTPETVEQLRARILAEPIKSISGTAPWRPGRDFAEVIAEVRKANPDLHAGGLGYSAKWGWKWGPGDQDRAWAEMTEPGNVAAFSAALSFLSHAGRRFSLAKVNHKRTSYSWKHVAERVMGIYISNGMLIAAAYALGFTVAPNDTPNPCINLGEKATLLDPDRGL